MILLAAALSLCFSREVNTQLANSAPGRGNALLEWHTAALWIFDNAPYADVTLTGDGPYCIDLRMETGFVEA